MTEGITLNEGGTAIPVEEYTSTTDECDVGVGEMVVDEQVEPDPVSADEPAVAVTYSTFNEDAPDRPDEDTDKALDQVLRSAHLRMGDKDPEVIAWCRDNLSPEDFADRYAHRNIS
jgi:hypothetical protein